MTRAIRIARSVGRAALWFVIGWLACFGQGLWGSKLHSLLTGQGVSAEKRARARQDDDRFDLWDTDKDTR